MVTFQAGNGVQSDSDRPPQAARLPADKALCSAGISAVPVVGLSAQSTTADRPVAGRIPLLFPVVQGYSGHHWRAVSSSADARSWPLSVQWWRILNRGFHRFGACQGSCRLSWFMRPAFPVPDLFIYLFITAKNWLYKLQGKRVQTREWKPH